MWEKWWFCQASFKGTISPWAAWHCTFFLCLFVCLYMKVVWIISFLPWWQNHGIQITQWTKSSGHFQKNDLTEKNFLWNVLYCTMHESNCSTGLCSKFPGLLFEYSFCCFTDDLMHFKFLFVQSQHIVKGFINKLISSCLSLSKSLPASFSKLIFFILCHLIIIPYERKQVRKKGNNERKKWMNEWNEITTGKYCHTIAVCQKVLPDTFPKYVVVSMITRCRLCHCDYCSFLLFLLLLFSYII